VFSSLFVLLGSILYSRVKPENRIWPPPSRTSWQYYLIWTACSISFFGIALLGYYDWRSFGLSVSIRVIGGVASVLGGILVTSAIATLGSKRTQGLGGDLVDSGPYRWSRNPQYLGDILLLLGFAVLSDSLTTLIACAGASICLWLAPFIEESWLEDRLGQEYSDYRRRVQRFIGFKRN